MTPHHRPSSPSRDRSSTACILPFSLLVRPHLPRCSFWSYPIKGLTPAQLDSPLAAPGLHIPGSLACLPRLPDSRPRPAPTLSLSVPVTASSEDQSQNPLCKPSRNCISIADASHAPWPSAQWPAPTWDTLTTALATFESGVHRRRHWHSLAEWRLQRCSIVRGVLQALIVPYIYSRPLLPNASPPLLYFLHHLSLPPLPPISPPDQLVLPFLFEHLLQKQIHSHKHHPRWLRASAPCTVP